MTPWIPPQSFRQDIVNEVDVTYGSLTTASYKDMLRKAFQHYTGPWQYLKAQSLATVQEYVIESLTIKSGRVSDVYMVEDNWFWKVMTENGGTYIKFAGAADSTQTALDATALNFTAKSKGFTVQWTGNWCASRLLDPFDPELCIQNEKADREVKQKALWAMEARDRELDKLFERIYEDNVSGKLTDERFARMSERYDAEQKELAEKIKTARKELEKSSTKVLTKDMFLTTVRKYTPARKLTQTMLNELVDHIDVHQAEKVDGVWEQRLTIHYNVIGPVVIPSDLPLPVPEVTVNTRKGVWVNYAAAQKE